MKKLSVCILFGGMSPEHEVSLRSAESVLNHIDESKYNLFPVGITKEGDWILYGGKDYSKLVTGEWRSCPENRRATISPVRGQGLLSFEGDCVVRERIDVVFPVLHGENGEDGAMQGLLQMAGIPYVGPHIAASAVAMDKSLTKLVADQAGVPQAAWQLVRAGELENHMENTLDLLENRFRYPMFVKPAGTGSSVGVSKVGDRDALRSGLRYAGKYDKKILVEEFINGGSTLRAYMERRGPLSDLETKNIALQICNGLKQVHKLGIVHRDINPNNIMLAADGTVKIIDFGISRTVKRNQSCDTEILGTQGFTAPEQFGFHQTGPKADIYSMGVLINVMATGCLPGVKLVNGWLSEIVLKCTQIDETNRYRNMDDLILDLERRSKLQRLLRTVPGFRKGIWWHQLIAVLYYFALLFFLIVAMSTAHSLLDALCTFGFFFFGYAVPVPILTNYLDWTHRIARLQNKTKSQRIWIQISLSALAQVLSVLCIIASPAT